jgi:hypothetical protein
VGRQSYVLEARDQGSPDGAECVLKLPAFDYRRPLEYGRADARRMRAVLEREYEVLCACRSGHLPSPLALVRDRSPVPAAEDSTVLANDEVLLAEERIHGTTLTEAALRIWPALDMAAREEAAGRLAREVVAFWVALRDAGWHYCDLGPYNVLLEHGTGRVRIVDGGSVVPAGDRVVSVGFTPAFTTPNLFKELRSGRPIAGDLTSVLPLLAKLLHFALTRVEPLNGALPELASSLRGYSPACEEAIARMLRIDGAPESLDEAMGALNGWAG